MRELLVITCSACHWERRFPLPLPETAPIRWECTCGSGQPVARFNVLEEEEVPKAFAALDGLLRRFAEGLAVRQTAQGISELTEAAMALPAMAELYTHH